MMPVGPARLINFYPECLTAVFIVFITLLTGSLNAQTESCNPSWIPDACFYQIFPERFRNGDPSNDPDRASLDGSWPHDTISAWQKSPWTSDWYKLQPWEEANGKGFNFNVQRRRYGGDIQGIIDKLDYIKELGVNVIYLNPIFESPSLHKYDAANYTHIDDNFGPNPKHDREIVRTEIPDDPATWIWTTADQLFLNLVREAHSRNIRIILDGVFNHVGIRHWAFRDVEKNGAASRFKDWFTVKSWDNPATAVNEFDYVGWVGVRELPELSEDQHGLVEPVKRHVFDILERWMDPDKNGDPSDGIDGWRLDVAEMVSHHFWKEFRKKVKSINPEAYITGEIFWDNWQANKLMDPTPWLQGDEFDGVMNYRWAADAVGFFVDQNDKLLPGEFAKQLEKLDDGYKVNFTYQLQNLLDSHDTERIATTVINPDLQYDRKRRASENPKLEVRKPNENEWQIVRLMLIFQFTYPGPPMIYYGGECGMWGGDDPDERKSMVWDDMQFEDEVATITKIPRPVDRVRFDHELFSFYKKLITLRNEETVLRRGGFNVVLTDDRNEIFAYSRQLDGEKILVVFNNSERAKSGILLSAENGSWKDLLSGNKFDAEDAELEIQMQPKSALVLKRISN